MINRFFSLAEKSDSNLKQTTFLDTRQVVAQYRNQAINEFLYGFKKVFESFQKHNFSYATSQIASRQINESLELVKNSKLDETLVQTNIIKKSEAAYHKHLFAFQKRFSKAIDIKKLNLDEIPISPFIIVHLFKESIKCIDIETQFKLILYKSFERNVMGRLNNTYRQINDLFIAKGIVPEIKYNLYGRNKSNNLSKDNIQQISDNQSSINPSQNNHHNQQNSQQQYFQDRSHDNYPTQQNLDHNYHMITQFLSQSRQTTNNIENNQVSENKNHENTYNNDSVSITNIDLSLVINALTILQNNILNHKDSSNNIQNSPNKVKAEIFEQLHKIDSNTVKQKIKPIDEDTIDLVGLLFQFIINDKNIPKTIQLILVKLQLPYLKIALQDRNLFGDKKHEARVLLDTMAVASVGWSAEYDLNNQFINKIEEITNHIIEIDEYNNKIFDMLLINFEAFLTNLKKKSDVSIKRSNERAKGDEDLVIAREKTSQVLVDEMKNQNAPILVKNILLQEWSSILTLVHLKFLPDTTEFKNTIKFISSLIEYSQPQTNYFKQKKTIDELLTIYENGLKFIIFKRNEIQIKIHELKTCLYKIHNISSKKTNEIHQNEILYTNELLKIYSNENIDNNLTECIGKILNSINNIHVKENTYSSKVSNLKLGTWLKFSNSNNTWTRAKLTWISQISGVYIFVNSRGFKIIEKTTEELKDGFEKKSIKVLLQIALFDRALSSIANDLNKKSDIQNS